MPNPCESCAFRKGAGANCEPYNRLRSEICALSGVPFFCHHGLAWQKAMGIHRGIAFDTTGNTNRAHVCEGWKARVAELAAAGLFRHNRQVRRVYGVLALEAIDLAIHEENEEFKTGHWKELKELLEALVRKHAGRVDTTHT